MTLREADADSGNIAAEVQGTDPYSVKVSLRSDGEWTDATCSCPDGVKTQGKCKHVGAVLLKAAAPSNTKAAQITKAAAPASTGKTDVVCIIDDDEPPPQKVAAKAAPASATLSRAPVMMRFIVRYPWFTADVIHRRDTSSRPDYLEPCSNINSL